MEVYRVVCEVHGHFVRTFRGGYASGVSFPASRRKHGSANFFTPEILNIVGNDSSGATPELTRGTRVLLSTFLKFVLNHVLFKRLVLRDAVEVAVGAEENLTVGNGRRRV